MIDCFENVVPSSGYMCGASNIHRYWALSAAHCLDFGTDPTFINLHGGSTSRISRGHLFFVKRYILHPSYDRSSIDLDVAVIEVQVIEIDSFWL